MNTSTYQQTQFDRIREWTASYCISTYGKAKMLQRQPATQLAVVETWQAETAEAKNLLTSSQHVPFMGLQNLEHITKQLEKGFVLEPQELVEYADFLRSARLIRSFFEKNHYQAPILAKYSQNLQDFSEIEAAVYGCIRHNQVADEASREIRKIRKQIRETEKEIDERLRKFLRHKDNLSKVQENVIVKKGDSFTIPIKASYKNTIPGTIVEASTKGTTVFIEPQVVSKLNERLVLLKAEETAEAYQILASLTGLFAEKMNEIAFLIETIVEFDIIFARGKFSREIKGSQPMVNKREFISLQNVLHPLLGDAAVPLTVAIGGDNSRGLTITGPNAGGKTVVLKTVGLITLMVMFGLQIHCSPGTDIAVLDQIFVDIGDQQSMENALSTFSGHLHNLAAILNKAKRHTLVLLDEIGSGTEPNEGAALAIAILEDFYQKGSLIISTTHYGEIKNFSQMHEDFATAAMAFEPETLQPLYQLLLGQTGDSNAFWIAKKMNIQSSTIRRGQQHVHHKDYQTQKLTFQQSSESSSEKEQVLTVFDKGDRVQLTENDTTGIVYDSQGEGREVHVFVGQEMVIVPNKRLRLLAKAEELYPENYDLNQLFEAFSIRKQRRDLERGSKKAQKQLTKEVRQRQLNDKMIK